MSEVTLEEVLRCLNIEITDEGWKRTDVPDSRTYEDRKVVEYLSKIFRDVSDERVKKIVVGVLSSKKLEEDFISHIADARKCKCSIKELKELKEAFKRLGIVKLQRYWLRVETDSTYTDADLVIYLRRHLFKLPDDLARVVFYLVLGKGAECKISEVFRAP